MGRPSAQHRPMIYPYLDTEEYSWPNCDMSQVDGGFNWSMQPAQRRAELESRRLTSKVTGAPR